MDYNTVKSMSIEEIEEANEALSIYFDKLEEQSQEKGGK